MPFSYTVDPARQLVTITLRGEVTGETILAAHRAVAADPAWRPGFARCWDYRGVERLVIARGDAAAIQALVEEPGYQARRAATVVTGDNEYVVTQLFGVWTTRWPVRAFWTVEDAHAWLVDATP